MEQEPQPGATGHAALPDSGLFGGRFEIESVLGSGGSSVVYKANDRVLERTVALKLLYSEYSDDSLKKFRNESKASRCLEHAHIVKTLAEGITSKGQPYLVMELLVGKPLNVMFAEGTFDRYRFEQVFLPIIDALSYAHDRAVIHADIKPSNILISLQDDGRQCPKLLDFGIARILACDSGNVEATVTPVGTPLYMSPEQCTGGPIDERSDIYSLAVVMYEALAGRTPFTGETSFETMYEHLSKTAPDFDEITGPIKIPRAVAIAILKALNKQPSLRQISMQQFKQELLEALSHSSGKTILGMKRVRRPGPVIPLITVGLFGICALSATGIWHWRSAVPGDYDDGAHRPAAVKQAIGPYPLLNAAQKELKELVRRRNDLSPERFSAGLRKVEAQLKQAIRLSEKENFKKDKKLQFTLHFTLAEVLDIEQPEEALKEYRFCKRIFASDDPGGRMTRLEVARKIAELYSRGKRYKEAKQELVNSIHEFRQSGSEQEIRLANQYGTLSRIMAAAKEPESEIAKVRQECIRIAKASALKYQSGEVITAVLNLSDYHRNRGDMASARRLIKEAEEDLALHHSYFGGQQEYGYYLKLLATGYCANQQPDEALRLVNLALEESSENSGRKSWLQLREELKQLKVSYQQQLEKLNLDKAVCD